MEVTIDIAGDKRVQRKIRGFESAMPGQIRKGLNRGGGILLKSVRDKISGDGFTRNPGRSSPYPGIASGEMFRTMFSQVESRAGGMQLRVGPKVHYGAYQELGTRYIQARPFMAPTWDDKGDEAIDVLQEAVMEGWPR